MTTESGTRTVDVNSLPPATQEFAHRMFDAAREGNAEVLLAAVDAGLPVNLTNDKGNTLLMLASYSNHPALVSGLLARGADPNRLNDRGQSPLAGAVFKGYEEVVRVLDQGGADPWLGRPSAAETAVMFNRKEMLEMLGIQEGDAARLAENVLVGPGVAAQCPIGGPRSL
ncbi:ankyrin [Pisolithus orientalis]|uniref:ankyrin n=1 Tax=Pisolithus orientalis TaxID=936130 RepID=UPI0022252549|nr:ankyrin [Pisolithus orientalis]KAI6006622.1 ankyrin [Pisolithus orientalis]